MLVATVAQVLWRYTAPQTLLVTTLSVIKPAAPNPSELHLRSASRWAESRDNVPANDGNRAFSSAVIPFF